jgi:drug/metabolite transporter (DMT)-like permease
VLFSTMAFMSLFGTRYTFGTPITARALAGATLGVSGVALLFLPELAAAGTALATGGNLVSMRMQRLHLPIVETTAWGMGYGALIAAIVAMQGGVTWSFDARAGYVVSLAYLAVFGSIVAFLAYLTLLKQVGAGPASYVGVMTPVIAMFFSTLLEGYRWSVFGVIGVVLAVIGNVLVLRSPRISPARPIRD